MSFFTDFIKKFTGKTQYVTGGGTTSRPTNRGIENEEICNAIIDCNATHISRGQIMHVVMDKDGRVSQMKRSSTYSKLFNHPNPMMSRQDFVYAMAWNLQLCNTAFAWIKWDKTMQPVEVWPLVYLNFEIVRTVTGYAVRISDTDGRRYVVELENLVCLRRKYDGTGYAGRSNRPIDSTLSLADSLDAGLEDAVTISNKIHGILKKKNSMFVSEPADAKSTSLELRIQDAAKTGSLILDGTEDYEPVNFSTWSANFKQSEQIYERIYTFWRTPSDVVKNTASEQVMQNYYDSVVEPVWEEFGEALTSALFTRREQDFGNRMLVYSNDLTGASWDTKITVMNAAKEQGLLTVNEERELLRMPPVEDGDIRLVSLNYIKSSDMSKYQTGANNDPDSAAGSDPAEGSKNE